MKKEYLIPIALILILGAYLLLHKENKDNYSLPEVVKIDTAKVTGLVINSKKETIKLMKKEKDWFVTDEQYPAKSGSVENMLDTIKGFKLSALISQKDDKKRYMLDEENRILVKVMEGDTEIFEFSMGKTAPTANHTFVMLKGNTDIYHANGNFKSDFSKTVPELRDKKVLELNKKATNKVTLTKADLSKTFVAQSPDTDKSKDTDEKEVGEEKAGEKEVDTTKESTDKEETVVTWTSSDGAMVDNETITKLISSISFLECEEYLTTVSKEDLDKKTPLCTIQIENSADPESKSELKLFKDDEKETLTATSSMNNYAFALSQYNSKEIISDIGKLLGIAPKEEETK
jgi:hypothetical protein